VRYASLSAAKAACLTRMNECSGVVDDGGVTCGGAHKEFELRTGRRIVASPGNTAWARSGSCGAPPAAPVPPPGATTLLVPILSSVGGAVLAVVLTILIYACVLYRRMNPPLLSDDSANGDGTELKNCGEPEEGWQQDSAHLLSPLSINYYLKAPGTGLYETMKAVTG